MPRHKGYRHGFGNSLGDSNQLLAGVLNPVSDVELDVVLWIQEGNDEIYLGV